MAFDEVQFPTNLSKGVQGGPGFATAITETTAKAEERVAQWADGRHSWDASYAVRSYSDIAVMKTFFMARKGALRGFRFKDWVDYKSSAISNWQGTVAPSDQVLGTGDGVTTTFQLKKNYTSASISTSRIITKPVTGTVRVSVNGSEVVSGWTVNTSTGIVTFTSAPALSDALTAGFEFDVPARFEKSADQMFRIVASGFDAGDVPSIPIIELINETAVDDEMWNGGSNPMGVISASASITLAQGRLVTVTPGTGGLVLTLPDYTSMQTGGPLFAIFNESGANTIAVKDHLATAVITMAILTSAELWLTVDSGGNKKWIAR